MLNTGKLVIDSQDMIKAIQNVSPTVNPSLDKKFTNWDKPF